MRACGAMVWWDDYSVLAAPSGMAWQKGWERGGENGSAALERRYIGLRSPGIGCSCPKGGIYFISGSVRYMVQPPDCAPEVISKSRVIHADVSETLLGFK